MKQRTFPILRLFSWLPPLSGCQSTAAGRQRWTVHPLHDPGHQPAPAPVRRTGHASLTAAAPSGSCGWLPEPAGITYHHHVVYVCG